MYPHWIPISDGEVVEFDTCETAPIVFSEDLLSNVYYVDGTQQQGQSDEAGH